MDIVQRLRAREYFDTWNNEFVSKEAADEIERLREALRHMLRWHDQLSPADIAKAKAALEKE